MIRPFVGREIVTGLGQSSVVRETCVNISFKHLFVDTLYWTLTKIHWNDSYEEFWLIEYEGHGIK